MKHQPQTVDVTANQHTLSLITPKLLSKSTLNLNTPSLRYAFHRETIVLRYACSSGLAGGVTAPSDGVAAVEDGGGKNASERRSGIVALKSDGVTSETNHGMSLGLEVIVRK